MNAADELLIARQASAWMSRRDRDSHDPGEYLGVAWLRVRSALAADPNAPRSLLSRAARLGSLDHARTLRGWRRRGAAPRQFCVWPTLFDFVAVDFREEDCIPDREPVPPIEHRLLAIWCECRRNRHQADLLARVWAYLWLVEGWDKTEIGAVWKVSGSAVCLGIYRAGLSGKPVVPRKPQSSSGYVRSLTTDQQDQLRREFAARGAVGSQAWIRAAATRLGVGHATIRRVVYRCGAKRREAMAN